MWLSFSCILEFSLFPLSLHNTCICYYLHSQIDVDKDSVFWLVNLHPSWKKIGCISIPSKSVQVFWFKFLVWYTRSKNLNSRNLDAKLVSCIPGLRYSTQFYWIINSLYLRFFSCYYFSLVFVSDENFTFVVNIINLRTTKIQSQWYIFKECST